MGAHGALPLLSLRDSSGEETGREGPQRRQRHGVLPRLLGRLGGGARRALGRGLPCLTDELVLLLRNSGLCLLDLALGLGLDIGLLRERLDRVAELLARLLDLALDLLGIAAFPHRCLVGLACLGSGLGRVGHCRPACARVFAHCTSSFTLSVACSGVGGAACWTLFLP